MAEAKPEFTTLEYKCPCCTGALTFDSKTQKLKCEYCDNEFSTEQLAEYDEILKEDGKEEEPLEWKAYEGEQIDGFTEFVCPSCGAAIVGDSTTAATFCAYCGNPVALSDRMAGMLKPDYVIPFKLDKKAAEEALQKFYKGKILLPKLFKTENNIQKITGMYVPFWLYSGDAHAKAVYDATKVSTWRSGSYRYTKTSHFMVRREGNIAFQKVPVDGSQKMDDSMMDSLEPYNYNELTDFQTAYLAGYFADRYDMDSTACNPRAEERVRHTSLEELRRTVVGYATVVPRSNRVSVANSETKYAMLPVWILNTQYKGETYTFAMNGQTGKMVGKLPIDRKKYWLLFGGVFAAAMLLGQLLLLIGGIL